MKRSRVVRKIIDIKSFPTACNYFPPMIRYIPRGLLVVVMFVDVAIDGLDVKSPVEECVEEVVYDEDDGYWEEDIGGGHLLRVPNGIGLVIQISREKVDKWCGRYPIHPNE